MKKYTKISFVVIIITGLIFGVKKFQNYKRTQQDSAISYNRDIRPILSDKCFACHGPDANKRKAGLRLDQQAGAYAELKKK